MEIVKKIIRQSSLLIGICLFVAACKPKELTMNKEKSEKANPKKVVVSSSVHDYLGIK
jgi:hypothetical protein